MIPWLKRMLGMAELEARIRDLERHFITKRDEKGTPIETLADVPFEERGKLRRTPKGMSWPQLQAYLEATDGGRRPMPATEKTKNG